MSKINIFKRLQYSFNPNKYRYLVKDTILNGIIYLLVMSCLLGIISGSFSVSAISKGEKILENTLKSSELNFKFSNGLLEFSEGHWIDDNGENLLLIDTDKTINEIDDLRSITIHKNNEMVFLKDGFMIKSDDYKRIYTYEEVGLGNRSFDNYKIANYISKFSNIKYLIVLFIIIIKFFNNLMSAICVMLISAVVILVLNLKISYSNTFALSVYSLTIPNILGIIFSIGSIDILISSGIMFWALLKIKKEQNF